MADDDLAETLRAERLGDAEAGLAAIAHYCEALRLLLPAGIDWSDHATYDLRMGAFQRIQGKVQGCQKTLSVLGAASAASAKPDAGCVPPGAPDLPVYKFAPGLTVRIGRDFTDYDGQEIVAGEVLHFLDSSYFPYESGHTLRFAEKTIRIAGIVDEHEPIIENRGNEWFQPLS